jgi:hypothetical protein
VSIVTLFGLARRRWAGRLEHNNNSTILALHDLLLAGILSHSPRAPSTAIIRCLARVEGDFSGGGFVDVRNHPASLGSPRVHLLPSWSMGVYEHVTQATPQQPTYSHIALSLKSAYFSNKMKLSRLGNLQFFSLDFQIAFHN